MKFVLIAFVLIGAACAQYDYQPAAQEIIQPAVEIAQPEAEYLPPASAPAEIGVDYAEEAAPAAVLADDGYRYRTVKKFKYRTLRRRV